MYKKIVFAFIIPFWDFYCSLRVFLLSASWVLYLKMLEGIFFIIHVANFGSRQPLFPDVDHLWLFFCRHFCYYGFRKTIKCDSFFSYHHYVRLLHSQSFWGVCFVVVVVVIIVVVGPLDLLEGPMNSVLSVLLSVHTL